MKPQLTKLVTYAIITAFFGFSLGCATTQEVEALKQQIQTVETTASQANTKAERAQSDAAEALTAAEDARVLGEESQACCRANSEKMNRMFDQVQQK